VLLALYFCLFGNLIIWVPVFCNDFGWFAFWLNHLLLHPWGKNSFCPENYKECEIFYNISHFDLIEESKQMFFKHQFNFILVEE